MKTIELKLYQINELSEEAKEKALADFRYINVDNDWWYQCTMETFSEFGVVIKSFDLYKRQIELDFKYDIIDICEKFAHEFQNNEVGETCKGYLKSVDAQLCLDASDEEMLEDMEGVFIKDLEYAIMNWLDSEYEYLQSDDAVFDTLEANEYEFTEDGKRFRL
jgi:hypothetical protein